MDHDAALDEIFNLEQLVASSTASIPLSSSSLPLSTVTTNNTTLPSSSSSSLTTTPATFPSVSTTIPPITSINTFTLSPNTGLDDDIHDVFADLERELADIGIDAKLPTASIMDKGYNNNTTRTTNSSSGVQLQSMTITNGNSSSVTDTGKDDDFVLSSNLNGIDIPRSNTTTVSSSIPNSSSSFFSSKGGVDEQPLSPLAVISDELHNQNPYATSTMDAFPLDIPLPDTPIPWSTNDMNVLNTLISKMNSLAPNENNSTNTTTVDNSSSNSSNAPLPSTVISSDTTTVDNSTTLSNQIIDLCMQHHCLPPSQRSILYSILLKMGKQRTLTNSMDSSNTPSFGEHTADIPTLPDVLNDTPSAEPLNEEYIDLINRYVNKTIEHIGNNTPNETLVKLSATEISRIIQAYITSRLLPYNSVTYFYIVQITVALSTFIDNRDTLFVVLFDLMEAFFPRYFHRYTVDTINDNDTYYSQFGSLLHSLCMYHEPDLCTSLDQTYPLWYTVQSTLPSWITDSIPSSASSVTTIPNTNNNTPSTGTKETTTGCIPIGWMECLFLGNDDTKPTAIVPLLDRLLLSFAVLGKRKIGTLHTIPSPVNFSILSLCTSLILREAVSLRVICRTAVGGAGARTLLTSTLASSMKRMLWSSTSSSSVMGNGSTEPQEDRTTIETNDYDEYLSSSVAWIAQGSKLANSTPQSVFVQYKSLLPSSLSEMEKDTSLATVSLDNTLKVSVREILSQIVYGWPRVAIAAEKERNHTGTTKGSDATVTDPIQEVKESLLLKPLRSLLPCPTSISFPLRFLLIDVRPMSHRKAGRIAIAYNIDARTCVRTVNANIPALPNKHEVDMEEAAVTGETVTPEFLNNGEDNHAFLPSPPTSPNSSFIGTTGTLSSSTGSSSLSVFSPLNESSVHHEGPSALTYVGIPLNQAIEELKSISGKLHVVITGIGARLIPAAYQPYLRKACFEADDERIMVTASAFMNAGFRYVSILDGGYTAIHTCVRGKGLLPPSLLPLLDNHGNTPLSTLGVPIGMDTEDVAMSMRGCMIDHSPRKCPFCRHTAVLRLMAKQQAAIHGKQSSNLLSNFLPTGNTNLRSLPPVQDVAKVAADLFDGLVHSASETVANLRTEFGIQPTDIPLPTGQFSTNVVPSDLQLPRLTQAQIDSMMQARDRTMGSILDALRSGSEKVSATASNLARDMAVATERVKEASVTTNLSKQLATKLNEVTTKIQAPRNTTKSETSTTEQPKVSGKVLSSSVNGTEESDTNGNTTLSSTAQNLISPTKILPEADGFAIGAEDDDENTTGTDNLPSRTELNTSSLSDDDIPSQSLSTFTANSKVSSPSTNAIPVEVRQKTKAAVLIAKGVLQSALAPPPPTTATAVSSSSVTNLPISTNKTVANTSPSTGIVPPPLPSWSSIEKAADIAGNKLREGTKTLVSAANQAVNSPPQPGTLGAALANMDKRKVTTTGPAKTSPPVKSLSTASSPSTTSNSTSTTTGTSMNNTFASFRTRLAGFSEKAQEGMKIVAANIASTVPPPTAPTTTTVVRQSTTSTAIPTINETKSTVNPDHAGLLRSIDEELENSLKSSLSLFPIQALVKGDTVDIDDVRFRASSTVYSVHKQSEESTKSNSDASTEEEIVANVPVIKPRILALSRIGDRLIILSPIENTSTDDAATSTYKVKANHSLTELAKVSYSKKKPGRIVLWYRKIKENNNDGTDELKERIYHFTTAEQAHEFLQNLQRYQQQHSIK